MKTWSKRTAEITEEAEKKIAEYENALGQQLSSAERIAVAKTAVLKTRPPKEQAAEPVLHAYWRDEAAGLGWDREALWRQVTRAAERIRRDQAGHRREPPAPAPAPTCTGSTNAPGTRPSPTASSPDRSSASAEPPGRPATCFCTRRNDRRLPVGDGSYVRNGDRFRVLGPGPAGWPLVEDLSGRGRTALPAEYLARHAQRGWASTIDTAQGCTADVGVVLVRAGMDREHLYVGMSRGRLENHAHVAPEPADDQHHLGPPPEALTAETARMILAGCLRRVGTIEQQIHDLPRLRGRGRRTELTTRLDLDRIDLNDTLNRLRQLDHELLTLKGTVEYGKAEVERERSRLEKSYMRPTEPSWERPSQPTRRGPAPSQPEPHRSLSRRLPIPGSEQRGRGIEL